LNRWRESLMDSDPAERRRVWFWLAAALLALALLMFVLKWTALGPPVRFQP